MHLNKRDRVLKTLSLNQPDSVPIDFGGHRSSGINPEAYRKLRQYLGLPERPIKVYDMVQQLAVLDEDVLDLFGVDTVELGRGFCQQDEDWKAWTLTDGTDCLIPAYIDVKHDNEDWVLYHGSPSRKVGIQKPGMHFFDQTYWPYLDGVPQDLSNISDIIASMMWSVPSPQSSSHVSQPERQVGSFSKLMLFSSPLGWWMATAALGGSLLRLQPAK